MVKIKGTEFTFGADPEIFVLTEDGYDRATVERDRCYDSVYDPCIYTKGTKEKPEDIGDGIFLQADGMALEFNIPPCRTHREFQKTIDKAKKKIDEIVKKKTPTSRFGVTSTVSFSTEIWSRVPKERKILGCDPDYDAYAETVKVAARGGPDSRGRITRYAGGHLHIGWGKGFNVEDPEFIKVCASVSRELDIWIGLVDFNRGRRSTTYGSKGAFRPKPYGIEYRVPDSTWIWSNDTIRKMFKKSKAALNLLFDSGGIQNNISDELKKQIVEFSETRDYRLNPGDGILRETGYDVSTDWERF